ncbi:MAG TPA: TIGR02117 family protein [Gammaproteobacteria bacterium]|nr:TIGR02117 family protein [Gammaproteobacteria bacterium]
MKQYLVKLISGVLALLVAGCSTKPYIIKPAENISSEKPNKIYVVGHDWHTGFIIPANRIQRLVPGLAERFGNADFLELGWGDKGFYLSGEMTAGLVLRAIFWPTDSVMHVVAVSDNVHRFFPGSEIEPVYLSDEEYASLLKYISNSFYRNKKGEIIKLEKGLYGNSQFYAGEGDYFLMNTCNKWTAKGLRSAGMGIGTTFSLTADSVMNYLQAQNKSQAPRVYIHGN